MTLSLRRLAEALEPGSVNHTIRLRPLLARIRWESEWQGTGPSSLRMLTRGRTLRDTLDAILPPGAPRSFLEAQTLTGMPASGQSTQLPAQLSLRSAAERVAGPQTAQIRLLAYNTYLLPGLVLPVGRWLDEALGWDALSCFGIPLGGAILASFGLTTPAGMAIVAALDLAGITPSAVIKKMTGIDLRDIRVQAKPALDARASELPEVLCHYDICCLCEVFTADTKRRIIDGLNSKGQGHWRAKAGPNEDASWTLAGSGLYFAARDRPIAQTECTVFGNLGEKLRDSDAWSRKGAMLNTIDLGFGKLELFQTHLFFGGGLPTAADPLPEQRRQVQRAELDELARFYEKHHDPANVAIVVGDFNLDGTDPVSYSLIHRLMNRLRLHDLWAWDVYGHRPYTGLTNRFTDGPEERWQRTFEEQCSPRSDSGNFQPNAADPTAVHCEDGPAVARPYEGVGRFDYILVERPNPAHRYTLETSRPLRRPFRRRKPSEGESFLSDHMGLDLTLYCRPR